MTKNLFPFILGCCFILFSSFVISNNTNSKTPTVEDSRASFYYILDNRFEGKSDAFIDLFNSTIAYPDEAKENCRMGLSKISFNISKEGKMSDVKYNQRLGFGIEDAIDTFLKKIDGKWKAGRNKSEFEMTIGFRIKNGRISYRPEADLMIIATPMFKWSTGDVTCGNTNELFEKMKKYIKRKKYSKAKPIVEELLRRFPDDATIQENHNKVNRNSK